MMRSKLFPVDMQQVLLAMADAIINSETVLNALDAAIGDGDHGIVMRLGFEAIRNRLAMFDISAGFQELFTESGKTFIGVTGGTMGIILGKSLLSVGTSLRDAKEFATPELKTMLATLSRHGNTWDSSSLLIVSTSEVRSKCAGSPISILGEPLTCHAMQAS